MRYIFVLVLLATSTIGQLADRLITTLPIEEPTIVGKTNRLERRTLVTTNTPIEALTKGLERVVVSARNKGVSVSTITVQKGNVLVTTITTVMPDESKTNDVAMAFGRTIGRALERKRMRPSIPQSQEIRGQTVIIKYQDGRTETKALKRATSTRPEKALAHKLIQSEVTRIIREGDTEQALQSLQQVKPSIKPVIGGIK